MYLTIALILATILPSTATIFATNADKAIEQDPGINFDYLAPRSPRAPDEGDSELQRGQKSQGTPDSYSYPNNADRPKQRGAPGKAGGPQIQDMPINLRHQVLEWATIEQGKKQRGLRKQSIEASAAASKSEEDEFYAIIQLQEHNDYAKSDAKAHFERVEQNTKQHLKAAAKAKAAVGEQGLMMETVGGVDKDMRKRMKEAFQPLQNSMRRVKSSALPPFVSTGPRKGVSKETAHFAKSRRNKTSGTAPEASLKPANYRGLPGRPSGPSIVTMSTADKQDVLQWTMQNQWRKHRASATEEGRLAETNMNAAHDVVKSETDFRFPKGIEHYREARRKFEKATNDMNSSLKQYKAVNAKRQQTGETIERVGLINKEMRHRMKTTSEPFPREAMLARGLHLGGLKLYEYNKGFRLIVPGSTPYLREKVGAVQKAPGEIGQKKTADAKQGGIGKSTAGNGSNKAVSRRQSARGRQAGVQPPRGRFQATQGGRVRKSVSIARDKGGDQTKADSRRKGAGGPKGRGGPR